MPDWLRGILTIMGIWSVLYMIAGMLPKTGEKVVAFATREERARRFTMRRRDAFIAFGILVAVLVMRAIWSR